MIANDEPATTGGEVNEAAFQVMRKVSGFQKPSQANQPAFDRAVEEVAQAVAPA